MHTRSPDHVRVMRTAAWMWIAYLASLAIVDLFTYSGGPAAPVLWYHLVGGLPALAFLVLSRWEWSQKVRGLHTPLMILLITGAPILINHVLGLRLPQAPLSNLEGMILRQLPVLFIGLVLVAWHYRLATMLLYSVATNLFELSIVLAFDRLDDPRLTVFYFITIIRTVCFIAVGVFINLLITYLRAERESLELANSRLTHYASTLESLTVSRERNRLSRELHDTVVHTLSGLAVQLETLQAYLGVDAATAETLLAQSLETARSGLQETRRAVRAMRASPLDDLGLVLAIRKLIDAAAERGQLLLDVSLPDQALILSPDVEQCVYRIAQEAVENVIHHAGARRLAVTLTVSGADVVLVVHDDGIGFSPEAESLSGHFGLAGMRERAQLAGGVLSISSKPSFGTTIRLMVNGG